MEICGVMRDRRVIKNLKKKKSIRIKPYFSINYDNKLKVKYLEIQTYTNRKIVNTLSELLRLPIFKFSKLQFFTFCICFIFSQFAYNQTTTNSDTIIEIKEQFHSPKKAAIMSAALPGLGQAYNKKYWKIPIIYGAIGTSIFFAVSNNSDYNDFRNALKARVDGDPNTIDKYEGIMSVQNLESNLNFHQRNRDLSIIIAGVFYALNIIDATVDAHLFSFPKNDNLSLHLKPTFQLTALNQVSNGFSLTLRF